MITTNYHRNGMLLVAAMLSLAAAPLAKADSYSTGFEAPSFTAGSIDNQNGWSVWNDSNGPVEEVTTTDAYLSAQSWRVSNEWVNGVVQHENTPALAQAATQAGPITQFATSFKFKAASAIGDGSYIQISPDDASGGRMGGRIDLTHVAAPVLPFDGRTQPLNGLQLHWDTIATTDSYVSSPSLDPTKWYDVSLTVDLVPGTGVGGAPNDVVSLVVTDTTNNTVVWDVNSTDDGISTWEAAGFGGTSIDRLTFRHKWQSTGVGFQEGVTGVNNALLAQPQGFYIDDLSIATAVPEPATLALAGAALLGLMTVGRRRA